MKTYKREVAFLMFAHAVYLSVWGDIEALKVIIWPWTLFIGAAYGMDWVNKHDIIEKAKR